MPGVARASRRRIRAVGWAFLVLIVAFGLGARRMLGPKLRTEQVKRRDFSEHLIASGSVRTPIRAELGVLIAGIAAEVPRKEGDHVEKGELLLRLADAQLEAQVAEAQAAVVEARARLTLLSRVGAQVASATLRRADAELKHAEQAFARTRELVASGGAPPSALEDAERVLESTRTQRDAANVQALSTGEAGADLLVARAAVQRADAALSLARARLDDARVLAPCDGVLLSRDVDVGDIVTAGKPLFVLVGDAPREIVFYPDERNLRMLTLGQKGTVSADAFADQRFQGTVSYVAPSVDPERGTVEVRLSVPDAPPYLRPEMTVSVDVALGDRQNVLAVPTDAVREATGPKPYVFVVQNDKLVKVPVRLGLRSDAQVEIVSGLRGHERVVVEQNDALSEGQRVRAVSQAP